ncbi:uncharacterized protein V6R79_023142 [Siganus canaliculatus]
MAENQMRAEDTASGGGDVDQLRETFMDPDRSCPRETATASPEMTYDDYRRSGSRLRAGAQLIYTACDEGSWNQSWISRSSPLTDDLQGDLQGDLQDAGGESVQRCLTLRDRRRAAAAQGFIFLHEAAKFYNFRKWINSYLHLLSGRRRHSD